MQNLLTCCLVWLTCTCLLGQGEPIIFGSGQNQMGVGTSSGDGSTTQDGQGLAPNLTAASRFLGQAAFGADKLDIESLAETTFEQWIDSQFVTEPALNILDHTIYISTIAVDSTLAMGGDPNNVDPDMLNWTSAWWQYTLQSPDVLRNRVALALSEIMVVSEVAQLREYPLALASYYDVLLDNSFGNFRDLLYDVTMHPSMGLYLTHVNNPKSLPAINRFPDENYAREVMQLFTIGLYELNLDGSHVLDSLGDPIPSYDNNDISQFAKVFTGLTYPYNFLFGQDPLSNVNFLSPMTMFNSWHEPGTKTLLNGFVVPNRQPVNGMADVNDALDNLYNHPNVGPFIGFKLIQRLVKSNPTPAYIARVAAVFNNNGSGVRGDMKAVIKAILLDSEARDCALINDPYQGMLREPIVRYVQLCRTFNISTPSGLFRDHMSEFYALTFQRPLGSSSVFNFFQPWYAPSGPISESGKVAPEFQILNSLTILGYANELNDWAINYWSVFDEGAVFSGENVDPYTASLDLTPELALAAPGQEGELVEHLNLLLCHGNMSIETRAVITELMREFGSSSNDMNSKVRMAIFLTMISPDYLILR
jgi:uncharacterized protein (DUF1800 family)